MIRNAPILHPNHFLVVSCKQSLFNLKVSSGGDFDLAYAAAAGGGSDVCVQERLETVNLGLDILKVADLLEPGLSKLRGAVIISNKASL